MMVTRSIIFVLTFMMPHLTFGDDFLRDLPEENLLEQLEPERFKGEGAVIVLKEQSFKIIPSNVWYRGVDYSAWSSTSTKVVIAKMFTEDAVERYGSFEYVYRERFGDEIKSGIEVRARVLKPDGDVVEMEEDEVRIIVHRENSLGEPTYRKILFKVPDLAIGDVVQIESTITQPFTYSRSGIFYYNDRDPVLFSNLYITLPRDVEPLIVSLPAREIGQPQVTQLDDSWGAGDSYFWGLRNLNGTPKEPYAPPFSDLSLLTSFVFEPRAASGLAQKPSWNLIASQYYDDFLDKNNVSPSRMEQLGFATKPEAVTIETADQLYANIRKMIVLDESHWLFPVSDDIDSILEKERGNGSDAAYIMYNILMQWGASVNAVWIRDARDGIYEKSIPTTRWFDRLGVVVQVGGKEKLYDFDRCISASAEEPWFLDDVSVVIVREDGASHRAIQRKRNMRENGMTENHFLTFSAEYNLRDSMNLSIHGAAAQRLRGEWYETEEEELQGEMRSIALSTCLRSVDTVSHSGIFERPAVDITLSGSSQAMAEKVEGFIAVHPRNHFLRSFREEISSSSRYNHLLLDGPFIMELKWAIEVPEGYALDSELRDTEKVGVARSSSMLKYTMKENVFVVEAVLRVPNPAIEYQKYDQFVSFLKDFEEQVESQVLFREL